MSSSSDDEAGSWSIVKVAGISECSVFVVKVQDVTVLKKDHTQADDTVKLAAPRVAFYDLDTGRRRKTLMPYQTKALWVSNGARPSKSFCKEFVDRHGHENFPVLRLGQEGARLLNSLFVMTTPLEVVRASNAVEGPDEHERHFKKPRQDRPEPVALCKIYKRKKSTELVSDKVSFQRLVREISQNFNTDLRFQSSACLALQEAADSYIVEVFEDAKLAAINGKHGEIRPGDMQRALRGRGDRT